MEQRSGLDDSCKVPASPRYLWFCENSVLGKGWAALSKKGGTISWLQPELAELFPLSADLYSISNTRGKVGKFCIFKTVYKIGEDIIGTFNFSEGDIPCLQVSAAPAPSPTISVAKARNAGSPLAGPWVHVGEHRYPWASLSVEGPSSGFPLGLVGVG